MKKKVAVVGGGPAGFFAAFRLADGHDVTVYDLGRDIEKRSCSLASVGKCAKCRPCNIIYGIGGAGLFSDGKLMFNTAIGSNLGEIISPEENQALVDEVEGIFASYGVKISREDGEGIKGLRTRAMQNGISFVYSRQSHIGSDCLGRMMASMRDDLVSRGVRFVTGRKIEKLSELEADNMILAPGRGGAAWLEDLLKAESIEYTYRPVDIGVRVEVAKEITAEAVSISRDMKFHIVTEKYGDAVRTFCTCPEGFVDIESHDGFVLVNGHSDANNFSDNTNFALIVTVPLTKPLVNTNVFANLIARLFNGLGSDRPIMQRLGDLKRGRRSREENQHKFICRPTLRDVTYGDISLAMPYRYVSDLVEALDRLDAIMPGIAGDSTILYAPEIKFHGLHISTDNSLGVGDGVYVAGDGAGVSRGIVGAAASGLLCARGIENS